MRVDDAAVALRLLVDRGDELGVARTFAVNRLHRLLVEPVPGGRLAANCSSLHGIVFSTVGCSATPRRDIVDATPRPAGPLDQASQPDRTAPVDLIHAS